MPSDQPEDTYAGVAAMVSGTIFLLANIIILMIQRSSRYGD